MDGREARCSSIKHNEITNNILLACGNNSTNFPNIALAVGDYYDPNVVETGRDNVFESNIVYKSGISDVVFYRGQQICISGFNALDGTAGDTIQENVQFDPLFTDPEHHVFSFGIDSACQQ